MKIFAKVTYKGTNYQGWQRQTNAPTVQEEIEKVLSKILNDNVVIYGSGRTDGGVHARGQTFHFEVKKEIDINRLRYSVNCLLPNDIHINSMEVINDDFHARFSAIGKHYSYTILVGENNPLNNEFVYTYPKELNTKKLEQALVCFNGEHNFQDFTSKEEDEAGFKRKVNIELKTNDNIVTIDFYGNGFMKYMIRFMVGAVIAVAEGRETIDFIKNHLDSNTRQIITYKAPSEGLVLEEVMY